MVQKLFPADEKCIDFVKMSKDLELHRDSYTLRFKNSKVFHNIEQVKETLRNLNGADPDLEKFAIKVVSPFFKRSRTKSAVYRFSEGAGRIQTSSILTAKDVLSRRRAEFINTISLHQKKAGR